jgi:hypothetical protein
MELGSIQSDGEFGRRGIGLERLEGEMLEFQIFAIGNLPDPISGMILFFGIGWDGGGRFGLVEGGGLAGAVDIGQGAPALAALKNRRGGGGFVNDPPGFFKGDGPGIHQPGFADLDGSALIAKFQHLHGAFGI